MPRLMMRPDGSTFVDFEDPEREWYSVQQAARRWGYHPQTVHRWIHAGRLPEAIQHGGPGGGWRVPGRLVEAGRPDPSGPPRHELDES